MRPREFYDPSNVKVYVDGREIKETPDFTFSPINPIQARNGFRKTI
jgi:hypothetical protein